MLFRSEGDRFAHSLYLEIAAQNGIPGLICFLAIVVVTLRELLLARRLCAARYPQLANMASGFFLAIVVYLSTGLFLHLTYARYFWLILALAAAAAYVARKVASSGDRPSRGEPRIAWHG